MMLMTIKTPRVAAVSLMCIAIPLLISTKAVATDDMNALAEEAARVNPKLAVMERQVAALRHKSRAVQTWMDPVVAVEYANFPVDSWALGDSAMTGIQLKVTQTFPFPGKNERREAVVLAEAEATKLDREEMAVQLKGAVKEGYLSLTLVRQLKAVTAAHIAAVDKILESVRLRYEVGRGNQQDVLRMALLKDRLTEELEEFDKKDREITASINNVLHRDPRTKIETPKASTSVAPPSDLEPLVAQAKAHRPELAALDEKARASRLAADQAAFDRKPDFSVWLGYRFRAKAGKDDGTDQMSIGAAVPLPFDYLDRADATRAEHLERAKAIEYRKNVVIDEIGTDIEKSLAVWQRAYSKERNYRETLVPQAQKTLEAAMLAYETDRADFFSIFRSEVDLIEFERAIRSARITTRQMKAKIETIVGKDIEAVATGDASGVSQ